jgi:hypothetical protein
MAYHVPSGSRVVRGSTQTVAGLGFSTGIPGVDVDLGGVTINTSDIANKIVGALWPPVEQKVNALVPVVANTAIDIAKARMPELIGVAMPLIKKEVPGLIDMAWPQVEGKANKFISTYEARYTSMAKAELGPLEAWTKYTTPVLIGMGIVGLLVTAAALKTLKK